MAHGSSNRPTSGLVTKLGGDDDDDDDVAPPAVSDWDHRILFLSLLLIMA